MIRFENRPTSACTAVTVAAVAVGFSLSGCAAGEVAPDPTPLAPSPPPSASPDQSPTVEGFDVPDRVDAEIARAVFAADGPDGVPTTTLTTYDTVRSEQPFRVEGQCVGDSVTWEVIRASPGNEAVDSLLSGTLVCEQAAGEGFSYSSQFEGPVQFRLRDSSQIESAWLRVVPHVVP